MLRGIYKLASSTSQPWQENLLQFWAIHPTTDQTPLVTYQVTCSTIRKFSNQSDISFYLVATHRYQFWPLNYKEFLCFLLNCSPDVWWRLRPASSLEHKEAPGLRRSSTCQCKTKTRPCLPFPFCYCEDSEVTCPVWGCITGKYCKEKGNVHPIRGYHLHLCRRELRVSQKTGKWISI